MAPSGSPIPRPAPDPPAADESEQARITGRRRLPGSKPEAVAEVEEGRAAAFFDLDRTLMAGSSGLPWARAATKAGLISRRQMARWGVDALKFRLHGATDDA